MHNLPAWISPRQQRHLSTPAILCVLIFGLPMAFLMVIEISGFFYSRSSIPRAHVANLLSVEKQYYKAHGNFVFGTDAELRPLMKKDLTVNPGICPRGGHHSVIKYGMDGILVRCTLWHGAKGVYKPPIN